MNRIKKLLGKYESLPVQVKASIWFVICSFFQRGISMLTTPIFTRLLSTAEYGKYSIFNSWLGVMTIIVSMNLAGGVYSQGLIKFQNDRRKFSSSLQGLSSFLIIIWTLIYLFNKDCWKSILGLTTVQMLAMLVMIWTTSAFNFWANEQRFYYRYKALVLITLFVSIAKPILGILLVMHADDKVTARILGLVLVEFVFYVGLYVVQMYRGKIFYNRFYWSYALKFNIPLIPHYLSQTVLNNSDRIMIDRMIGSNQAGIYSLAYSLAMILSLVNTAIGQTLSPWIYQKIKNKKISEIKRVAYISLVLIAMINIFLIAFAPEAVAIFAPSSYYEAIWVIPPITMSVYFVFSYDLFAKFAFYYEKTHAIMVSSVLGAVLNIVLNYIFIKQFGYLVAGYTTLVCYMVYSVAHYCLMIKVCDKYLDGERPYSARVLMIISVSFLLLGFLLMASYSNIIIRYMAIIVIAITMVIKRKKVISIIKEIINIKNAN